MLRASAELLSHPQGTLMTAHISNLLPHLTGSTHGHHTGLPCALPCTFTGTFAALPEVGRPDDDARVARPGRIPGLRATAPADPGSTRTSDTAEKYRAQPSRTAGCRTPALAAPEAIRWVDAVVHPRSIFDHMDLAPSGPAPAQRPAFCRPSAPERARALKWRTRCLADRDHRG